MRINEAANPTSRRILVVEDHDDSRRAIARLLEMNGHEVRDAGDGVSALELARSEPFELALIDISLPDMDGVELLTRLRRDRAIDAIAVTGHALDTERERCTAAGFRALVIKPIAFAQLLKMIERLPDND